MRVFSVPVSAPFLRTVIAALVDGRLIDGFAPRARPAELARATLYLPTRRAGRMAREIFLDELKTDAVVLPRIVALGDIDEDELAFAEESEQYGGVAPLDIPPKLGELERRLTLARLVAAWAKTPVSAPLVVGGPASTLALAGDLARLMDDMVTRGVGWEALDGLVPDQLDKYWQHSLEFLRIARQAWPAHLEEIGKIEPAARRGGASGPRYRSRRRSLAVDRRCQGRARQIHPAAGVEPSAVRDAGAAASIRHRAPRCRNPGRPDGAWARCPCVRNDAAFKRDGGLASAAGPARHRRKNFARYDKSRDHRGRQFRDGGAGDCGCDARGAASRQNGSAGDAGSRAGATGDGGARPLESRI